MTQQPSTCQKSKSDEKLDPQSVFDVLLDEQCCYWLALMPILKKVIICTVLNLKQIYNHGRFIDIAKLKKTNGNNQFKDLAKVS